MRRKAKHHYIPKCYLKGFTNGGENNSPFWSVPISNTKPFITSPNDSCAQRDYYSVEHSNPLIVEDFYAEKIEPKIGKAINHINTHSCLPIAEDMEGIILLLATLYLRVPSYRESLEAPLRVERDIVESMRQDLNILNYEDFNYSKNDLIKMELSLIDTVCKSLSEKYYQLYIIEDENLNLITSDRPFILSHPSIGKGFYFGLNTPNIEICVPITSKALLLCRNERIKEGTFKAMDKLIGLANRKIILASNRFFYSKTDDLILVDEEFTVYKHNINNQKK
ncbi:DUF4238 domain-containing protein [Photobacterium damselae]